MWGRSSLINPQECVSGAAKFSCFFRLKMYRMPSMFLQALWIKADGWDSEGSLSSHVWKRVGQCCLHLARCQSFSVHLFWPQFKTQSSMHPPLLLPPPSSRQWSWDRHQAEAWPLLTEMRFVLKSSCWGIAFNITAWSDSHQLDTVCLIRHEVLNWLVLWKNVVTRWRITKITLLELLQTHHNCECVCGCVRELRFSPCAHEH